MKRAFAILAMLIPSLQTTAADWQKVIFDSQNDNNWEVQMTGYFKETKAVSPGEHFFSYKRELKRSNGQLLFLYQYNFAGRTGDKTFELVQIEREGSSPRKERKISVYLDADTPMPLKLVWPTIDAGCGKSEAPKLKMIKLAGNDLELQVLLPDCLKRQPSP